MINIMNGRRWMVNETYWTYQSRICIHCVQCTLGIDAYIPNVHWWVGKMPVSVGLAPGGLYKVVYKITALRTHRNCLNQLWPWLPCTGPAGAAGSSSSAPHAAAHTGNFWRLMWSNWSITLHLSNLYYFRMLDEGQDLQPRPHRRSYSSNFEASKANVNFPHLKARRWYIAVCDVCPLH